MLSLQNVSKTYQAGDYQIKALQNIDLEIKAGDFISILGPSGSGKSTLLNLLGGLDKPDRGHIAFRGQDLQKMSDRNLSEYRNKHVGFVFQTFNLIAHMNALENVKMPLVFNNTPLGERHEIVMEAIKKVKMSHRTSHLPAKLSGGERQRIAIARALVKKPAIILADEPTGNLDSQSGRDILDLLIKLNKQEQVTLVIVTHEDWIAKKARRIIRIRDGQIDRKT